MKKVALISSYCDTLEKKEALKKNLLSLKSINLDVIVISPLLLSEDLIILCDHFIYTKENPVLDWPTKAISQWSLIGPYKLYRTYADYGWAGLNQVKRLGEFAINYDYDLFYHMIYDLVIDERVLGEFQKNEPGVIYPTKRENYTWPYSLHLMVFDRKKLEMLNRLITLESYKAFGENDAFGWLKRVSDVIPCRAESSELAVEDSIDYYRGFDFFNYSPTGDFKLFFQKTDIHWRGRLPSAKLLFYGFEGFLEIEVQVNGQSKNLKLTSYDIYDTGMQPDEIWELKLSHKNNLLDITAAYHSVKINDIEIHTETGFQFLP